MTTIKYPDPATGVWKVVGGVPPDAPSDGKIYGRKNGAWVEVSAATGANTGVISVVIDTTVSNQPGHSTTKITYV